MKRPKEAAQARPAPALPQERWRALSLGQVYGPEHGASFLAGRREGHSDAMTAQPMAPQTNTFSCLVPVRLPECGCAHRGFYVHTTPHLRPGESMPG